MNYYKVLKNNKAVHGGCFDYTPYLPKGNRKGKWLPVIKNIELCERGYHLTSKPWEWIRNGASQVWLVELKHDGQIIKGDDKVVVNTFRFVKLVETNTGISNTGLYNSGYRNSGDGNSGDGNSGNWNSGNGNSGYRNSGDRNSGIYNSGNGNSGDGNSGDGNSGNWNSCNYETGYFNTQQSKYIRVFNKKCLRSKWEEAEKPRFIYFSLTKWVNYTKKEMKKDKNKKLIGGHLRTLDYKEAFKKSFENTTKEDVELLLKLPNFDYKVFEEISGITKEMIKRKLQ